MSSDEHSQKQKTGKSRRLLADTKRLSEYLDWYWRNGHKLKYLFNFVLTQWSFQAVDVKERRKLLLLITASHFYLLWKEINSSIGGKKRSEVNEEVMLKRFIFKHISLLFCRLALTLYKKQLRAKDMLVIGSIFSETDHGRSCHNRAMKCFLSGLRMRSDVTTQAALNYHVAVALFFHSIKSPKPKDFKIEIDNKERIEKYFERSLQQKEKIHELVKIAAEFQYGIFLLYSDIEFKDSKERGFRLVKEAIKEAETKGYLMQKREMEEELKTFRER